MPSSTNEVVVATGAQIQEIIAAVESGAIEKAPKERLARYISWLAQSTSQGHFGGEHYSQVFEVVRLNMLRAMIEAFEERSKVTNRWVMFFAVLAVAATLMPYIIAPNPIFGTNQPNMAMPEAKVQDSTPVQAPAAPVQIQAQHPSSGPAKATPASSLPTSAGQR